MCWSFKGKLNCRLPLRRLRILVWELPQLTEKMHMMSLLCRQEKGRRRWGSYRLKDREKRRYVSLWILIKEGKMSYNIKIENMHKDQNTKSSSNKHARSCNNDWKYRKRLVSNKLHDDRAFKKRYLILKSKIKDCCLTLLPFRNDSVFIKKNMRI